MGSNNILHARIICPSCEQIVPAEIEVGFGETRQAYQYTIGDRYDWRPQASFQNGGRPENGNLDGEGKTNCPACGDDIPVKVVIRNDVISDVIFDNLPSPFYIHQPAQAVDIPPQEDEAPHIAQVRFNFDAEWLTDQRQAALAQLTELGVDIYAPTPNARGTEFRIMVPHGLHPSVYINIAYLMAQLVDQNFREPRIEYVDSYPHGVKYRVKQSGDV
jgi:hypothetical protein